MKNKKINIVLFICLILFLSINSMGIGVNDTSLYVTKTEFDREISNINNKISSIAPLVENRIVDYLTNQPAQYEAGGGVNLTLNTTNNKWTISLKLTTQRVQFPATNIVSTTAAQTLTTYTFTGDAIYSLFLTQDGSSQTTGTNLFSVIHDGMRMYDIIVGNKPFSLSGNIYSATIPATYAARGTNLLITWGQNHTVAMTCRVNSCWLNVIYLN